MPLFDNMPDDGIMLAVSATSKKHLIEQIAAHAETLTGVMSRDIFDALMQRERLGSTGIGHGSAIPHAVLTNLTHSIVIMTILAEPVSFDARDKKPVDIVCTILGPERADCDHLKLLSTAAKLLDNITICQSLRSATTAAGVKQCCDHQHATAA